jgi:hypothetical protein
MSGISPTQRTLKALREKEYRVGVVERFVGPLNIRVDLFHIIDLIAIRPGEIVGIQSCGQAFSEHHRKITEEHPDAARDWILAGGMLELWGWRKLKVKRGGKAMRWEPRVKVYSLADFGQPVDCPRGEEADPPGSA